MTSRHWIMVSDATKRALETFSTTGQLRADHARRRADGFWAIQIEHDTIERIHRGLAPGETVDGYVQRLIAKAKGSIQ